MYAIRTPRRLAARQFILLFAAAAFQGTSLPAQTNNDIATLQIKADQVTGKVSPTLYGLMTEEINFSYEGGLYGELIRNRTFKANTNEVRFWNPVGDAVISLDHATPLNAALDLSLKMDASQATKAAPAGIANPGYWGIPVKPDTTYHVSFYAKAAKGFSGRVEVAIVSTNGQTTFAKAKVSGIKGDWKKFEATLKTTDKVTASKDNQFVITTTSPGTVWFQQVSLFPPTYQNRPNGRRSDLMEMLSDMHPKFLRFPGGNYLEGDYFNERFDWKKTIGDQAMRPGHRSPWNYWSTDGFGLPEFLGWCEDLNMEPVLAVFAGYTLRHDYTKPGPDLEPYVQDALDEIEYVTGDASTKWGAQRIKDGHPKPLHLRYVEVGNEDWFDRSGSYDGRFAQFYDAIKAKYPQLQVIATAKVKSRTADLLDEHYYRSEEEMEAHALDYDNYSRTNHTKIFCGEWATRVGTPTPNMAGALGDAAWMTGMERNSDLVLISCYAPLFVNVSDLHRGGSMQWPSDLIGYDALNTYGSPSYYAQKMFSTRHGDEILATDSQNIPMQTWQPPARRRNGVEQPAPPAQQIRKMFFDATRDSASGTIFLKMVNSLSTPQTVKIEISGANVDDKGTMTVLKADKLDDTNSLEEPAKILPETEIATDLKNNFTGTLPPYSINILELKTK